jgi:hypothetical protein
MATSVVSTNRIREKDQGAVVRNSNSVHSVARKSYHDVCNDSSSPWKISKTRGHQSSWVRNGVTF